MFISRMSNFITIYRLYINCFCVSFKRPGYPLFPVLLSQPSVIIYILNKIIRIRCFAQIKLYLEEFLILNFTSLSQWRDSSVLLLYYYTIILWWNCIFILRYNLKLNIFVRNEINMLSCVINYPNEHRLKQMLVEMLRRGFTSMLFSTEILNVRNKRFVSSNRRNRPRKYTWRGCWNSRCTTLTT